MEIVGTTLGEYSAAQLGGLLFSSLARHTGGVTIGISSEIEVD